MKIFGRAPAFWGGLVSGLLAFVVSIDGFGLTKTQATLITAAFLALMGVYVAYVTKETLLSVGIGAAQALVALAVGFGFHISDETSGSIIAILTVVLGSFNHAQNSPLVVPSFTSPPDAPVLTSPATPALVVVPATGPELQPGV